MRRLIRTPLTWMVVAEFVVVGLLVVVAWSVLASSFRPAVGGPAAAAPDAAPNVGTEDSPLPDIPAITGQGARGPLPGLNLSSSFWRARLADINREQVLLVRLEWRIVHAGMDAARSYVENVVLPAIRRAERAAVG